MQERRSMGLTGVICATIAVVIASTTDVADGGCNYGYWGGGFQTLMLCPLGSYIPFSAATLLLSAAILLGAASGTGRGSFVAVVAPLLVVIGGLWLLQTVLWFVHGTMGGGGIRYLAYGAVLFAAPGASALATAWLLRRDRIQVIPA